MENNEQIQLVKIETDGQGQTLFPFFKMKTKQIVFNHRNVRID